MACSTVGQRDYMITFLTVALITVIIITATSETYEANDFRLEATRSHVADSILRSDAPVRLNAPTEPHIAVYWETAGKQVQSKRSGLLHSTTHRPTVYCNDIIIPVVYVRVFCYSPREVSFKLSSMRPSGLRPFRGGQRRLAQ